MRSSRRPSLPSSSRPRSELLPGLEDAAGAVFAAGDGARYRVERRPMGARIAPAMELLVFLPVLA